MQTILEIGQAKFKTKNPIANKKGLLISILYLPS
jgi:hypothetical protein